MSGKIIERRCMYILASEYIKELEEKGKENLNNNGDRIEHEVVDKNDSIIEYQGKIKELESDLEYVNDLYIQMEASREASIRKCYNYMVAKKVFKPEANPFESFFKWATM